MIEQVMLRLKKIIGQIQRLKGEFPVSITVSQKAIFEVGIIYPEAIEESIKTINDILRKQGIYLEWPKDATKLLGVSGGRIRYALDYMAAAFAEENMKRTRLSGRIIGWEFLADDIFGDELTLFVRENKGSTLTDFIDKLRKKTKLLVYITIPPERLKAMAKDDIAFIVRSLKGLRKVPKIAKTIYNIRKFLDAMF